MPDTEPTIANAEQYAAWNGAEGANWAEHSSERVDDGDLVGLVATAASIADGERVLDIGCGSGDLTRRVAGATPSGHAHGVDLSALLVDQARSSTAGTDHPNLTFEVADAQVARFMFAPFDAVLSHFGVMFFADPAAAFANIARSLRPGGRMVYVSPQAADRCEWYVAPLAAVLGRPLERDDAPSVMFSLADAVSVRRLLLAAGFERVEFRAVPWALWFGPDPETAAAAYLASGPVQGLLERHADLTERRASEALLQVMRRYETDDGVRIPGEHWLVRAVTPPTGIPWTDSAPGGV